jgi:hypothetical protein
MSRIQLAGLTNEELARYLDTIGVAAATPEDLQHVALRFVEIFRHPLKGGAGWESWQIRELFGEVTRVPSVLA